MWMLRLGACGIAIIAMAGEAIRSWGVGRPIAFWIDDVILGSLLLLGAWVTGRETPQRRAFFSGAWGVAAGMAYLSFFQKVFDPANQNAGNLSLRFLTALAGIGFVLTVAGLIASVALPYAPRREPGFVEQPSSRTREGAEASTVNRRMAALRRALRVAAKLDVVSRHVEVPLYPENEPRQGFLEPAEFANLIPHLPDDGLRTFVRWLYASGMRVGEARQLEWRDVQADVLRVRSSTTKNGRSRQLPLAGQLGTLVSEQRAVRRLDCPTIFHRDGQPIGEFRATWNKATKAAGLAGLLVHDLRRSSARNLVRAGVPERVAMEVTGHRTRSVFDRYVISSANDVRTALAALGSYTEEAARQGATVTVAGVNSDNLSECRKAAAS